MLDSWRGICACLVVIYHSNVNSHIHESSFVRGCFMGVDFFFVLSGFVITEAYRNRLLAGFRIRDFIVLRIARLYPLHAFMLAAFVLREILRSALTGKHPFSDPAFSLPSLLANLALVHSLGLFHDLTWNAPSWSISTEFYTYILFALAILLLRRRLWIAELAVVAIAPFVLARVHPTIDVTYDWGWLRCVLGFSVGALCYRVHQWYLTRRYQLGAPIMTTVELALLILSGLFIATSHHDAASIGAPFVFALLVLVFAQEQGAVSRLLLYRPFVALGALSYAIYMAHFLIQIGYYNLATGLGKILHWTAFVPYDDNGTAVQLIATPRLAGDALILWMLASIIAASAVLRRWVDLPGSAWIRKFASRPHTDRRGLFANAPVRHDLQP